MISAACDSLMFQVRGKGTALPREVSVMFQVWGKGTALPREV